MKKEHLAGVVVGLIIILLSVPLGGWYGNIYLRLSDGMEVERYIMIEQKSIDIFQIIGGIISLLFGIGYFVRCGQEKQPTVND
ncbi:MAG: hypothetical protein NC407_11275 [Lachnoclostridium sp.]|nr:hypothetical protein [Lachnoclostridium sp.]